MVVRVPEGALQSNCAIDLMLGTLRIVRLQANLVLASVDVNILTFEIHIVQIPNISNLNLVISSSLRHFIGRNKVNHSTRSRLNVVDFHRQTLRQLIVESDTVNSSICDLGERAVATESPLLFTTLIKHSLQSRIKQCERRRLIQEDLVVSVFGEPLFQSTCHPLDPFTFKGVSITVLMTRLESTLELTRKVPTSITRLALPLVLSENIGLLSGVSNLVGFFEDLDEVIDHNRVLAKRNRRARSICSCDRVHIQNVGRGRSYCCSEACICTDVPAERNNSSPSIDCNHNHYFVLTVHGSLCRRECGVSSITHEDTIVLILLTNNKVVDYIRRERHIYCFR